MRDTFLDALHIAGVSGHDLEASTSTSACFCASNKRRAAKRALRRVGRRLVCDGGAAAAHVAEHVRAGLRAAGEVAPGMFFEHLAEEDFRRFRASLGVSEEAFATSLSSMSGGVTQDSGKSGSLFWFSEDGRCILKSITAHEMANLLDMLPRYVDHVASASAEGTLSLLSRFFGAYRISGRGRSMWLVAMQNVFAGIAPSRIYDLKGTTEDRYVRPKPGKVMKDLNFEGHRVLLPDAAARALQLAVERDADFLRGERIMDYSLIVGIGLLSEGGWAGADRAGLAGPPLALQGRELVADEGEEADPQSVRLRIGIIDILVRWSGKKLAAYAFKKPTLGCFWEIDTEPPEYYQERFVHYVRSTFTSEDREDDDSDDAECGT